MAEKISATATVAGLTSSVQLGFIAGTLVFAVFSLADRFSSRFIFLLSSVIAAAANLCILWGEGDLVIYSLRFATGFFLAGIYPVGMKIVADLYPEKTGKILGLLVGALVFGTALPFLVRFGASTVDWKLVLTLTSGLAALGGMLLFNLVPKPQHQRRSSKLDLGVAFKLFRSKPFRGAAFGYFGHMWELYAFWSVLPLLFSSADTATAINNYLGSFLIIAAGGVGCVAGGIIAQKRGSKPVAFVALSASGICCLLSPFLLQIHFLISIIFLLIWGLCVSADSPQFSALVARHAPEAQRGTALTIVTSIGFAITIFSIQLLHVCLADVGLSGLWVLVPGPLFGLLSLKVFK